MSFNYKFTDSDIPFRDYPSNKVKNGKRYLLIRGEYLTFPQEYHYHQYLVSVLLANAIGPQLFTDQNDSSAFRRLLFSHIKEMTSNPSGEAYRATNADVYLVTTASDIELLFINDKLDQDLLKRLRSQSDSEMRGAILEISAAAAFLRAGYSVDWLKGESLPEFTASKSKQIDVEVKRRNRTGKVEFDMDKEIKANRQNLAKALKKKRKNPYIVFLDSDIPPKSSKENKIFYDRCREEFGNYELEGVAVVISNNGYEHDGAAIESGKNSVMVIQGNNSPDQKMIEEIIRSLHSKLPPPISSGWQTKVG
jgi:hypothetical protein